MDEISDIPALSMSKLPEGAEASYWFMRLLYNEEYMTCDKATFCAALDAEGLPTTVTYSGTPIKADWYTKRNVFGNSGYPWAAPEYKGDRNKIYTFEADLPNASKAIADTFLIRPVESWTDANIKEAAAALRKVYEAYKK